MCKRSSFPSHMTYPFTSGSPSFYTFTINSYLTHISSKNDETACSESRFRILTCENIAINTFLPSRNENFLQRYETETYELGVPLHGTGKSSTCGRNWVKSVTVGQSSPVMNHIKIYIFRGQCIQSQLQACSRGRTLHFSYMSRQCMATSPPPPPPPPFS
jgi:hypothetical protein